MLLNQTKISHNKGVHLNALKSKKKKKNALKKYNLMHLYKKKEKIPQKLF